MNRGSLSRLAPPEGWVAVGLLYVIGISTALSIDDARWFLGDSAITDFLPAAAVGGITIGLISARVGWGRWTGYLIGAILAALLLPLVVGERLPGEVPVYERTAQSIVDAGIEFSSYGRISAHQFGLTLLLFGLLVWGTGMFAASAVFRHRRPMAAIVAFGVLLVVNISATPFDQLGYLVIFSGASLLLLVRLHAVDERVNWLRARLGDPSPVIGHTLRAGAAFVVAALVGAFALTQTASSAPLATAWPDGVERGLVDAGQELANLFPFVTSVRGPAGQDFSANASIRGYWPTPQGIAFTAEVPADLPPNQYWRAAAFDTFVPDPPAWLPSSEVQESVDSGASLLDVMTDPVATTGHIEYNATVTAVEKAKVAVAPGLPVAFDQPTTVSTSESGSLIRVYLSQRDVAYKVTASILRVESAANPDGVSANKLRAAGKAYPPAISSQYAAPVEDAQLGPTALVFLSQVKEEAGAQPYDIAAVMERRFQEDFTYNANVLGVNCEGRRFLECFMAKRQGYCMHFASAMVTLLREERIAARLVMGYLPGQRTGTKVTVGNDQAHAWVEVYFPGWGWVKFDPTSTIARGTVLPAGRPVPIPSLEPVASDPENKFEQRLGGVNGQQPPVATSSGPSAQQILFPIVALLLVALVVAVVALRIRAGRGDVGVAEMYRQIVGTASRLGHAPRPNQTIYEYADSLAVLVPAARSDLMTVAAARVETTYGRRILGSDQLAAVAAAARRLRTSLLRLFFRRNRGVRRAVRRPRR